MKLTLPSPAKLNLFLHVVDRKPDGYHELQTLFHLLDYGDMLTFEPTDTIDITLINTLNIPNEQNLIWKAAESLRQKTGTHKGVTINIDKKLPMGGGLGGGSSNAATTLLALNHLWDTKLSIAELASLGKNLGADVPVFIRGFTAWGEGVGEILTPVTLPETWYLVITPNCMISTAKIFTHSQLTRDTPRITIGDFLAGSGHNDLEPITKQCYPEVKEAIDWLSQFSKACMTGSGASVFARFPAKEQASAVLQKLPTSVKGFIAKGINRSPLHLSLM